MVRRYQLRVRLTKWIKTHDPTTLPTRNPLGDTLEIDRKIHNANTSQKTAGVALLISEWTSKERY